MDPNENLKEQLALATSIVNEECDETEAPRLAELVLAMHEWITRGGFIPAAWGGK